MTIMVLIWMEFYLTPCPLSLRRGGGSADYILANAEVRFSAVSTWLFITFSVMVCRVLSPRITEAARFLKSPLEKTAILSPGSTTTSLLSSSGLKVKLTQLYLEYVITARLSPVSRYTLALLML